MSQDSSPEPSLDKNSANSASETPHRLILLGLLIIALSAAGWFGLNWFGARSELSQCKAELHEAKLELKETKMRLDAQLIINRRQAEMLKNATEGSPRQ